MSIENYIYSELSAESVDYYEEGKVKYKKNYKDGTEIKGSLSNGVGRKNFH